MNRAVIGWIFVAKCLTIIAICFADIGLMPDEAQYWTWSQELSYGYYSKPCGIAWQIALGTSLFGNTELGVRFGSLLLSFLLSYTIYLLAKAMKVSERAAFWTAIAFTFCPLGILSGFLSTTDCGFVLFWTMVCTVFIRDLRENRPISYVAIGLLIALGVQWKWPLYMLWLPILLFRPTRKTFYGVVISLIGLIPSLLWNICRDFSTFRHVFTSISPVDMPKPNPLEFLGAQAALLSPLLFGVLVAVLVYAFLAKKSQEAHFCLVTTCAFVGVVFALSLMKKMQGNWAVASFPTLFALLAVSLDRSTRYFAWVRASVVVSVLVLIVAFLMPRTSIPLSKDPWKEGLGWHELAPVLAKSGYDPQKDFLFSDRYQMTSILSFYGPEQKRAFFFNLHGLRKNQFCYWPGMPELCVGKTGYFVESSIGKDPTALQERLEGMLKPYFSQVTVLPIETLFKTKTAIIVRCEGYTGLAPSHPNKY